MSREHSEARWAIITGASSGIGKALAYEFAAGDFNLVLIARNEAALSSVAAQCANRHHVQTEVIGADLSSSEAVDEVIHRLMSASPPRRYEVLVNNAGFGIHGEFASGDIEQNVQLVNV